MKHRPAMPWSLSGLPPLAEVKKDILEGVTISMDPILTGILERVTRALRKLAKTDERFLSEAHLCRALHISRETVRTWRTRRVDPLPHQRPPGGRNLRYDLEEVQAWLQKQAELGRRR